MEVRAKGCDGIDLSTCVRFSHLTRATPFHARRDCDMPHDSSDAAILGSLVHCLTLEPETFESSYIVLPDASRTSKDGLIELITAIRQHAFLNEDKGLVTQSFQQLKANLTSLETCLIETGYTLIDSKMLTSARVMASAIHDHPVAGELLTHLSALIETTFVWRDYETGVACRGTMDCHLPPNVDSRFPGGAILDLKTTLDASPEAFAGVPDGWLRSSIRKWRYHWQADIYTRAFEAIYSTTPAYLWVAAEKADEPSPQLVTVIRAADWQLEQARSEYLTRLKYYGQCYSAKRFPGYPQGIIECPEPYRKGY